MDLSNIYRATDKQNTIELISKTEIFKAVIKHNLGDVKPLRKYYDSLLGSKDIHMLKGFYKFDNWIIDLRQYNKKFIVKFDEETYDTYYAPSQTIIEKHIRRYEDIFEVN